MKSVKNILLSYIVSESLSTYGFGLWCHDVYMYILYCDSFWRKLIDRIF